MRDGSSDLFRVDEGAIRGQSHNHTCVAKFGSLVITVQHVVEVTPETGNPCLFAEFGNRLIAGSVVVATMTSSTKLARLARASTRASIG